MNFNEIFRKNITYDDIKSDCKKSCNFSSDSIIFEVKAWIFHNETSILVFAKIAIFYSI